MCTYQYIFDYSHIREKANVLECSGNTFFYNISRVNALDFLTLEFDRALINFINSGQHVEYGRFSCSVRSDNTDDFTLVNLEAYIFHRNNAAESFRYSIDL